MLEPRNYWNFRCFPWATLQPRPCLLKTLAEQNEPTSPDMVWTFMTLAIRSRRFLAFLNCEAEVGDATLAQLEAWECFDKLIVGALPWTSMEVSIREDFLGKPLGRWLHVDEIPCKAYGSDRFWWRGKPVSQFSPFFKLRFAERFFLWQNHMTVVALASNLASLLSLFGSKSLSMGTRICMPHVTWCLHQALLPYEGRSRSEESWWKCEGQKGDTSVK